VVRAAVLRATNGPLEVCDIDLPDPLDGQVRVRVAAVGVCHSDLSLADGTLPQPVPAVLGHEAAGTVVSVGEGVSHVAPGDRVLLSWSPACGTCWFCTRDQPFLCERAADATRHPYATLADGTPLFAGLGTAAFAEETLVPATAAMPLPADVPLTEAALLGCAMLTGIGAVVNAARVRAGESVAVIGLGGVGLSVLQGARLLDADPILAIDASPAKEELARLNGATEFLVADDQVARQVRRLTGGRGVDHAFECVGKAQTIRLAWSSTRRGGRATVLGVGSKDDTLELSALEIFHFARSLAGCVYGSTDVARDLPVLIAHLQAGRLHPQRLVTHRIGVDDIGEAFQRMRAGQGGRSLVEW
jgi:S-(hydroxymethyl)glutathione dehydrogenase / alcohol dehydrogenase